MGRRGRRRWGGDEVGEMRSRREMGCVEES